MSLLSAAVLLFFVMDPLGNVPLFLAALRHVDPARSRKVIVRELVIALVIMVVFLFLGRYILEQLIHENPDIWTEEFKQELVDFMKEGVALEKEFVQDCLPEDSVGLTQKDFLDYVDYNADRRLSSLGLPTLSSVKQNPFLWLDEVIFLKKEKNFFETRVTEYQTSGSVKNTNEDDLI